MRYQLRYQVGGQGKSWLEDRTMCHMWELVVCCVRRRPRREIWFEGLTVLLVVVVWLVPE